MFNICHKFGPAGVDTEEVEELPVGDAAVLDHLRHAVGEGLVVQGIQGLRVHEHHLGLPETSRQVFPRRQVDGHLAPHRGIHLGQEGGGDLDIVHPPEDGGGGKAGQIPHHAAPQSHHGIGAGQAEFHHGLPQIGQMGGGFRPLPSGEDVDGILQSHPLHAGLHPVVVEGLHMVVSNHKDPVYPGADLFEFLPRPVQQPGGNQDVISPLLQIDTEGFHGHSLPFS